MPVKRYSSEEGSTLIFVLFIMLMAMLISSTVTYVILKSSQSSTDYSQSLRAHYAAESLVERSLYYIQAQRAAKTAGVVSTISTINTMTETLNNASTASIVATVSDSGLTKNLAQYQTQQYDIYGESYTAGYHLAPLTDLDNIRINWTESSTCSAGGSQVEVAFSSWTQFSWQDISDPSVITTRYILPCGGSGPNCSGILGVDNTHLYRVFVKPLNCSITAAQVTALDTASTAIETKNFITLTATGRYGNSAKAVTATTYWSAPLSDYFNFVLFSENQLTK